MPIAQGLFFICNSPPPQGGREPTTRVAAIAHTTTISKQLRHHQRSPRDNPLRRHRHQSPAHPRHVASLLHAGATLASFHAPEDDLAAAFGKRFPQAARADDRRRILEDKSIALVLSSAVNSERAPLGIA